MNELAKIALKKPSQLGLTKEQYYELGHIADARLAALGIAEDMQQEEKSINTEDDEN